MHSTQSSPSTPSRSTNQTYGVQTPVHSPQSTTSTPYRSPDQISREQQGAPTYPPQSSRSTPSRNANQTYGVQGAPVNSPQSTTSTPFDEVPWEPTYTRPSPLSTPARSVGSISRVPVGTRTSYQPKVQAAVSVAEVCRGDPPSSGS
jgi:hypothetical protein